MKSDPKQIALRIGLATRELPETEVSTLMQVLSDLISLPPSDKDLSAISLIDLKRGADGLLGEIDDCYLQSALDILQGKKQPQYSELPNVQSYVEGDMPNSIRIACASNHGDTLDGHFGSCSRFLIYQVSQIEQRLVDIREVDNSAAQDDKNAYRAGLINDCELLFVASIGGPAAAKVVRLGIHPIKKPQAAPCQDIIAELQSAIAKDAPPWLAKVMGQDPEERIRFEASQPEIEVES